MRPARVVVAGARGEHGPAIARSLGGDEQNVRNTLHVGPRPGT
ncbi:MAG: hypothetical protein AVDCRST_MAG73-2335 [uncultured Thermomicrobiales bacterium]|uniref:Uncharacterized protein n=1 Tax=uncultured Thermomicrobiales bacterium TaxID=1645740 RepID=A0A6J4UD05_9BACT|nr:MAG: hypothetical protein AVDCRST_MAG73-2335 [uncultured Thermomicrobiales bacterium]